MTVKDCRSFAGMVNFISLFCPEEEIKNRLVKLPVLHLLDRKGRFHLYSDTSKFANGSTLCHIQNGKPKSIAYASKRYT